MIRRCTATELLCRVRRLSRPVAEQHHSYSRRTACSSWKKLPKTTLIRPKYSNLRGWLRLRTSRRWLRKVVGEVRGIESHGNVSATKKVGLSKTSWRWQASTRRPSPNRSINSTQTSMMSVPKPRRWWFKHRRENKNKRPLWRLRTIPKSSKSSNTTSWNMRVSVYWEKIKKIMEIYCSRSPSERKTIGSPPKLESYSLLKSQDKRLSTLRCCLLNLC